VYSRRSSLVERIQTWGDYEAEITASISAELVASRTRTLLDVGANIGLVSLAVLDAVPDASIFAFEPGLHQHDLFAETIRANRLADRVTLSPLALSDRVGTARFAVHTTRHAAGDGFLDTGRAGRTRFVSVRTDTLDEWWARSGRPPVDVVKLDTEGSELLILRGASELIDRCRPVIFLEIHEENLKPYPFGPDDVRADIEDLGYELEAIGRADFVARPR
jgi:FkbM family methyltransferase